MTVSDPCQLSQLSPQALARIADYFKALGETSRLQILSALQGQALNVTEIMQATGLSQANASKHLKSLTQLGMVNRRQEGVCVYYSVAEPVLFEICGEISRLIARQMEQQRREIAELAQLTQR